MTVVPARGMIPCRINERRCLIVIYKFYWSLPGVIVTISGENKTNYPRHTTPASQPITNGKSLLWRWRWKSIFLMQTECLSIYVRCAKIYQVDCLRLSTVSKACFQANVMWIFLFLLTSFRGPCISRCQYQCIRVPLLCPAAGYLPCWCWLGVAKCGSLSLC